MIYVQIDEDMHGMHKLNKYIDKYKGITLTLKSKYIDYIDFEDTINTLSSIFINLNEIVIKNPYDYDLEVLVNSDINIIFMQLESLKRLTKEHNIAINIVYKTNWNKIQNSSNLIILNEMLDYINGYNINILIENGPFVREDTAYEMCRLINNKRLGIYLNIHSLKIKSKILDIDYYDLLKQYNNKYVRCIEVSEIGESIFEEVGANILDFSKEKEILNKNLIYVPYVRDTEDKANQILQIESIN
jgi:hypothetical protein